MIGSTKGTIIKIFMFKWGNWCDYQLSYGLNEKGNIIYISCALDIKVNDKKSNEIYKLLSNINQS